MGNLSWQLVDIPVDNPVDNSFCWSFCTKLQVRLFKGRINLLFISYQPFKFYRNTQQNELSTGLSPGLSTTCQLVVNWKSPQGFIKLYNFELESTKKWVNRQCHRGHTSRTLWVMPVAVQDLLLLQWFFHHCAQHDATQSVTGLWQQVLIICLVLDGQCETDDTCSDSGLRMHDCGSVFVIKCLGSDAQREMTHMLTEV